MGGEPVKRHLFVAGLALICSALAACGGLQKIPEPTVINAPTFPQPAVAPQLDVKDLPTELPPPVSENHAFILLNNTPQYRIGPSDVLDLVITRGPIQEKIQTTVRSTGRIFVLLAEVNVDGLTTEQAGEAITTTLAAYYRTPSVDVTVKEYNSKKVRVFGSVGAITRASGISIPLTGRMTTLEAIGKAGGFNANSAMDKVRITRSDGKVYIVNMFRYMQGGDPALEFVLDTGDTVFVPEAVKGEEEVVYLLGEVKKPGPVPYFPKLTMGQLIAQVGGWTDGALFEESAIVRATAEATEIYTVDLRRLLLLGEKRMDQFLQPNDIVFVPRTPIANWNAFIGQLRPTFQFIQDPVSTVLSIKALKDFNK
jgi:polysaccharide biosynthesis/export protein